MLSSPSFQNGFCNMVYSTKIIWTMAKRLVAQQHCTYIFFTVCTVYTAHNCHSLLLVLSAFRDHVLPTPAEKRATLLSAGITEDNHKHYTLLCHDMTLEGNPLVHRPTAFTKKTITSVHRWLVQYSLIRISHEPGAKRNRVFVCIPPLRPIWQ